jgi:hypothetical protein
MEWLHAVCRRNFEQGYAKDRDGAGIAHATKRHEIGERPSAVLAAIRPADRPPPPAVTE